MATSADARHQLCEANRKRKLEQLIKDMKQEEKRIEHAFLNEVSSLSLEDMPWYKLMQQHHPSVSHRPQWQSRLPIDEDGNFNWGESEYISQVQPILEEFCHLDLETNGSLASLRWCTLLARAFPEMQGWRLVDMLTALVLCGWKTRSELGHTDQFDFVEYFAGKGNLSRECIKTGWLGMAMDVLYSGDHDMTTPSGLRLALEGLFSSKVFALNWLATKCSSFVPLCQCQAQRYEENRFMGDTSKAFVRDGNALMDVTALLYLLSFLLGNNAVLEQPRGSKLPQCSTLALVLRFTNSGPPTVTYGAAFGQRTLKPFQLWSNSRRIEQMARVKPDVALECTLANSHDGRFTGKKDLLQESEIYTREFGAAVVNCFVWH